MWLTLSLCDSSQFLTQGQIYDAIPLTKAFASMILKMQV